MEGKGVKPATFPIQNRWGCGSEYPESGDKKVAIEVPTNRSPVALGSSLGKTWQVKQTNEEIVLKEGVWKNEVKACLQIGKNDSISF